MKQRILIFSCIFAAFLLLSSCYKKEEDLEESQIVGVWTLSGKQRGSLTLDADKHFDFKIAITDLSGTGQYVVRGVSGSVEVNPFDLSNSSIDRGYKTLILKYDGGKGERALDINELTDNKLVLVKTEVNGPPTTLEFKR